MPTIEIVAVNSNKVTLVKSNYSFAIREEKYPISHRNLFAKYLSTISGSIVHIGNPDFKNIKEGGFFAGILIDWVSEKRIILPNLLNGESGADQDFFFRFLPEYVSDLKKLFHEYISISPIGTILFLTDYQFGPKEARFKKISTQDFWLRHESKGINWNTCYQITDA